MINIALVGASGKMGRAVIKEIMNDDSIEVTNFIVSDSSKYLGSDVGAHHFSEPSGSFFSKKVEKPFDCIVDFATRENIETRLSWYRELKKPLLFCTTGLSQEQMEALKILSNEFPIFIAPNTSVLTALMTNLLTTINKVQGSYEINISEKHHKSKIDAPSGTAISLAKSANIEEKKIKSMREGEHGNWHKATISNDFEELEIKHSTANRNIYAQGALNIVKWFYQKPKNLYYMQTLIEDLYE